VIGELRVDLRGSLLDELRTLLGPGGVRLERAGRGGR
jgi:hypothetical protein